MCFPGLHLSLGIFNRLWTLLEEACTEVDLALAQESTPGEVNNSFNRYLITLRELHQVKQQHAVQRQHADVLHETVTYLSIDLPDAETDPSLTALRAHAAIEEKNASALVSCYNLIKSKHNNYCVHMH